MIVSRGRLGAVLMFVVLALVVAGCGGDDDDDGGGGSGGGGGTVQKSAGDTLTILGFGEGDDVAQARAKVAERALAPAKFKSPEGEFNDQQFLAQVASGDVPDLVYMDRMKVGTYAAKGALEPLTSCIEDQGIDMSQYYDATLAPVTYEDEVYGIPEFQINRTIIVNNAALKKAGVSPSDIRTTDWDKLQQVAEQLTESSGGKLNRIGFDPKIPEFLPMWAKANGADLVSEDGKTANLDDPKVIEALDFAAGLIETQGGWNSFKAFRDTWDYFGENNQVADDQVGAWPMEDWYWNVLADVSPKVDVTSVPFTDRQGNPVNWVTGQAWAIPRGSKHPDLACLWAKTITSVDAWMAAASGRVKDRGKNFTGLHTGNRLADEQIANELYGQSAPKWQEALDSVDEVQNSAFAMPATAASVELVTAWTNAVDRVLTGKQTAEEALKQAQSEVQEAIDANAVG
jgi:multiple sugar transport system substrate-binding protein